MLLFLSWTLKMTNTSKMIWSTDHKCPLKVFFIKNVQALGQNQWPDTAKICGIFRIFVKMCPYFMIWKPIWSVQHFTCLKFEYVNLLMWSVWFGTIMSLKLRCFEIEIYFDPSIRNRVLCSGMLLYLHLINFKIFFSSCKVWQLQRWDNFRL